MGFLKFLKRGGKKSNIDDLDIPPPPPANQPPFGETTVKPNVPSQEPSHDDDLDEFLSKHSKETVMTPPNLEQSPRMPSPTQHHEEQPIVPKEQPPIHEFTEPPHPKSPEVPDNVLMPPPHHEQVEIPRHPAPTVDAPDMPQIDDSPLMMRKPEFMHKMEIPKEQIDQHFEPPTPPHQIHEQVPKESDVSKKTLPPDDKPLFIKLDRFKEIVNGIVTIRTDLRKSDSLLMELIKSKDEKDKMFLRWKQTLKELHDKFIFIEKNMFKGD